jgi:formylglycine-generating enzyme required for sulfatase activity
VPRRQLFEFFSSEPSARYPSLFVAARRGVAALSKLVNSLSWQRKISVPVAVDKARTVFRIDLRDFKWNNAVWARVRGSYPYGIRYESDEAKFCYEKTDCVLPYVRADWFVFVASRPPLYHDVLQLPDTAVQLEEKLRVDVGEDIRTGGAARAGFNSSGVARFNRLLERHESEFGAYYWKSYDFAEPKGSDAARRNLFQHPLGPGPDKTDFLHAGGEIIFSLPNKLQGYMLVNADGKRINNGPAEIVKDRNQPDGAVVNGISCMSCHVKGILFKDDQIRALVEGTNGAFSKAEAERIRTLYPPRDKFRELQQADAAAFVAAVDKTGAPTGTTDPIVALAGRYDWELDLSLAAAEAGLKAEDLARRLDTQDALFSENLTRLFGQLRSAGGTVQRPVFAEHFADLVRELRLAGTFVAPTAVAATPAPFVNKIGMEFRQIEAGSFVMGSPPDEPGRRDNEGQRTVEISPFLIGVHPVTQLQYATVMGDNPSKFSAAGPLAGKVRGLDTNRFPVEGVSWDNAVEFCKRLSRRENRTYRLPTEAEWEYACRAGTRTAYSFGNDARELGRFGWHAQNSGGTIHPVGQKEGNAWGLYDMHGNVQEYCQDLYEGTKLVLLRGGAWDGDPKNARAAARDNTTHDMTSSKYGFRVVLEVEGK